MLPSFSRLTFEHSTDALKCAEPYRSCLTVLEVAEVCHSDSDARTEPVRGVLRPASITSRNRARYAAAKYIEIFYKRDRPHSTLCYITPHEACPGHPLIVRRNPCGIKKTRISVQKR